VNQWLRQLVTFGDTPEGPVNTDNKGKKMHQHVSTEATLDVMGGRMRALRVARGLRVNVVAKTIGVSRTTYSDWEAGHVKNPDTTKLGKFATLTDCTLDWLLERKGVEPNLTPVDKGTRRQRRKAAPASLELSAGAPRGASDLPIAEIAAPMSAHASELNLTPRALWVIPGQILEISFNILPEHAVLQRALTRTGTNLPFARGDYLLIDVSRTKIDEPGTYMMADPDGKSARRAFVIDQDGQLTASVWVDDLSRDQPGSAVDNHVCLGRVMGIFKPA
jgi:transcriptional regulator with XRE-family HTH domain